MVAKKQPRSEVTEDRRREILAAALECFGRLGYEKTTVSDVREKAGVSTGSLYHHFKSKEQLAAALYIEGVRQTQERGLGRLLTHRSAERGVRALVENYLDWVDQNREMARFLLFMRHAPFVLESEQELEGMNRDLVRKAAEWFQRHMASGALPALDVVMFQSIVYGPCSAYARRFLLGKTRGTLDQAKRQLSTAAWGALSALAGQRGRGQ